MHYKDVYSPPMQVVHGWGVYTNQTKLNEMAVVNIPIPSESLAALLMPRQCGNEVRVFYFLEYLFYGIIVFLFRYERQQFPFVFFVTFKDFFCLD